MAESPGNPASLHAGGRRARRMLEDARERIGAALGAHRSEVVFTSGATESNALAVVGGARLARCGDPRRSTVLLSALEHDAVKEQSDVLVREGFALELLPLGSSGLVDCDPEYLEAMADRLALVSLVSVCSELGTIQAVAGLVDALGGAGLSTDRPLIHTDAAQALSLLPFDFASLGVDLASFGGHKIGAPVGTGILLVRRAMKPVTDRPGGGHERGIRSGTPDVAGAVALAAALEDTLAQREEAYRHALHLRTQLLAGLPENARPSVDPANALPSIIHLSLDTWHPEAVLMAMDAAGISVSAGSACHAGVTRPSQMLLAMGATEAEALGVVRVSTGMDTTIEDIDAFLRALPQAIRAGQALDARETRRADRRSASARGARLAGTPMIDSNMKES